MSFCHCGCAISYFKQQGSFSLVTMLHSAAATQWLHCYVILLCRAAVEAALHTL